MAGFLHRPLMADAAPMACRGCAAKLPAQPLVAALDRAGLGGQPEDAACLPESEELLQSMDGFPALVSDPWLNGRLTALHACSDLWGLRCPGLQRHGNDHTTDGLSQRTAGAASADPRRHPLGSG